MRKTVIYTFILAVLFPLYLQAADRYFRNGAVNTLWSNEGTGTPLYTGSNWTSDSAGLVPAAKPAALNTVYLDASSPSTCTIDVDTAAVTLVTTNYTGTLHFNTLCDLDSLVTSFPAAMTVTADASASIIVQGNFTTLCALPANLTVNVTTTATVAANVATNLAQYIINASGVTVTASGNQYWGSYTSTIGTHTAGANNFTIVGSIVRTAGTCTTTGIWTQTGTGNLKWPVIVDGQYPAELAANGVGTIPTGTSFICKKLSGNGSVTAAGTGYLNMIEPQDNFWAFTGTITCLTYVNTTASGLSTGGAITLQGTNFIVQGSTGANPLLLDGNLNLKGDVGTPGNFLLNGAQGLVKFDAGSYSITATNITVGHATNAVTVDLGTGTHYISGAVTRGAGTPTLQLGSSTIALGTGGTLSGANLTATSDAGTGLHAKVTGLTSANTVTSVALPITVPALDCTGGAANGGSNTNCWWTGTLGVHSLLGGGMIGSARGG